MSLHSIFHDQAKACAALGSPFTAQLMALFGNRLRADSPVGDHVLNWDGDPSIQADSVPLRLAGALHRLVLQGDPDLTPLWPPHIAEDDALWSVVEPALTDKACQIIPLLGSAPQTNEVRRSAVIIPALNMIAAWAKRPLSIMELGASAGLNLLNDQFAVDTGTTRYGPNAPLFTLTPDWTGDCPAPAQVTIGDRRGVDLTPISATRPEDCERLMSYIWPDQQDRKTRTYSALQAARQANLTPDAGDAGDWLASALPRTNPDHMAVIYHTVAWQYFPKATKDTALNAMNTYGANRPLARVSMENDGQGKGALVTLTIWPSAQEITLGRADFHGRWVDWTGPTRLD